MLVLAKTFKSANLYYLAREKNFGWEREGLKQGHSVDWLLHSGKIYNKLNIWHFCVAIRIIYEIKKQC